VHKSYIIVVNVVSWNKLRQHCSNTIIQNTISTTYICIHCTYPQVQISQMHFDGVVSLSFLSGNPSFGNFVGLDPAEVVGESFFPFAFSFFGFALLSLRPVVVVEDDVVVVVSLMTILVCECVDVENNLSIYCFQLSQGSYYNSK